MKLAIVKLNNETLVMTRDMYNDYRLMLSTGDFHTHTVEYHTLIENMDD